MRDFVKRPIVDILVEFVAELEEYIAEDGGIAWKGLCPFHNDTNPSFYAYFNGDDEYSRCGCWSCWQEGGDVIDFIIKYQKEIWHKDLTFKEAIKMVADPLTPEQAMLRELDQYAEDVPTADLVDIAEREHNLLHKLDIDSAHRVCHNIDRAIASNDIEFINDALRRHEV